MRKNNEKKTNGHGWQLPVPHSRAHKNPNIEIFQSPVPITYIIWQTLLKVERSLVIWLGTFIPGNSSHWSTWSCSSSRFAGGLFDGGLTLPLRFSFSGSRGKGGQNLLVWPVSVWEDSFLATTAPLGQCEPVSTPCEGLFKRRGFVIDKSRDAKPLSSTGILLTSCSFFTYLSFSDQKISTLDFLHFIGKLLFSLYLGCCRRSFRQHADCTKRFSTAFSHFSNAPMNDLA